MTEVHGVAADGIGSSGQRLLEVWLRGVVARRDGRTDALLALRRRIEADAPSTSRWEGLSRGGRRALGALAALCLVLYPFVVNSAYWSFIGTMVLVFAIAGLSLMVLIGWGGLISFAQGTLLGIGAYSAYHFDRAGLPFPAIVLLCALITGTISFVMALPGLRLRGLSLGVLTLAFATVGDGAIFANSWFTAGVQRGAALGKPHLFGWEIASDDVFFLLALGLIGLILLFLHNVKERGTGRAFLSIKGSELGAVAAGLNPYLVKLEIFALSGALAGIAGAVFAYGFRALSPSTFGIRLSLDVMVVSVLGGAYHLVGALIAGGIFSMLPPLTDVVGIPSGVVGLATGVGMILVLSKSPAGIGGLLSRGLRLPERPARPAPSPVDIADVLPTAPASGGDVLELHDVTRSFGGVRAVAGVSLAVRRGTVTTLIGPNGAGKSTLFRLVTGQIVPDTGRVIFNGRDITPVPAHRRSRVGLGWTYQSTELFPNLTAAENVMVGMHQHRPADIVSEGLGIRSSSRREQALFENATGLLAWVGLEATRDTLAGALPFGVLRKLEVARALAGRPSVLLLDEPATGMNARETQEFGELLRRIVEELGITVFLIEHDMSLVMSISDHLFVMNFGELIASGLPADVQSDQLVSDIYLSGRR